MNAEQRFDELDRIVADGRNLVAGFEPARDEIVGEAVGIALQLGVADAARAFGQRDAFRETARGALQQIPDRDTADAAWWLPDCS